MPTQARSASARQFFARNGALSQWHPNYEYRAGQGDMAEGVESALAEKRHLIVARSPATTTSSRSKRVPAVVAMVLHCATQASRPSMRSPFGAGTVFSITQSGAINSGKALGS